MTELDACMNLLDIVIDTTDARAELAALRAERDAAIIDRDGARAVVNRWIEECNKFKRERDVLRARVDELEADTNMRELLNRAATVMNDTGNALNWPMEMPMEYAEMINELREASERESAHE